MLMKVLAKHKIKRHRRATPLFAICTIALLFFNIFTLHGIDIEEIERNLILMQNDTGKVNSLIKLGKYYCSRDNDKAVLYLDQALKLSEKLNFSIGIAKTHMWLGRTYYYKDEYVNSEFHLNYAGELITRIDDKELLANNYLFLGSLSDLNGDYIRAVDNFLKAIELADPLDDRKTAALGYHSIGMIHTKLNNHDTALEYFRTAMNKFSSYDDKTGIANSLNGIGDIYRKKGQYDKALENYIEAYRIRIDKGDARHIASSEYKLGSIYIDLKMFDNAIQVLNKSIHAFSGLDESFGICISTIKLAEAYNYNGDREMAEKFSMEALSIAENLRNDELLGMCYEVLATMASHNEDYSTAFRYLTLFNSTNEILAQKKKDRIIKETEARFQVKRLKNDVESLQARSSVQKRNIIILSVFAISLIVILLLTVLIFRYRVQAQRRKRAMLEQDMIIRDQREILAEKEKMLLEKQLETHNRVLAAKTLEMIRMNETLLGIMNRLQEIDFESTRKEDFKKTIKKIAKEIEMNNQNDIWNEFDTIFRNIHSNFYQKLLEISPDLTSSEIKIASLLKLNLNTKEIAAITYRSEAGIKSARYRLRKKLSIDTEDHLIPFLMQL